MGIAVDATGSKLYWTNARGRIQSANLDGSGIQNVVQDLSAPTDIVVSNGFIYWTEGRNSVRRVSMSGQKIVQDIAANLGTVGGLAVGGGKVYWTEMTAAGGGTINSANADGTGAKRLPRSWRPRWGSPLTLRGASSTGRTPGVESSVRTSTVPVSKTSLTV